MSVATCNRCRDFTVPWGDHIGPELMRAHQATDCEPCGCTPTQECDRHYLDADKAFERSQDV